MSNVSNATNVGWSVGCLSRSILGDPGADSGGEGKSKRATKKIGEEKSRGRPLDFSSPIFLVARLDFPSPPLSATGSPRMVAVYRTGKTERLLESRSSGPCGDMCFPEHISLVICVFPGGETQNTEAMYTRHSICLSL